jgi:phage terminase small subunit
LSLNEKQAAFVREYLVDLNATQAASRAGYSEKTAHSQGQRLLKNAEVRKAINAGKSRRAERVEVSADEVLRELMRLGFSDIANIFNPDGDLRAFRNIPEDTRRAISSIKVKSHTEPGDEDTVVWTTEFKLWDKPNSLGMLGKHLKLFTEKVELSGSLETLTDEQLQARAIAAAERLAQLSGGAGTTANAAAQSKGDSTASLGPDGDDS